MSEIDTVTISAGGKSATLTGEQFEKFAKGERPFDHAEPAASKFLTGRCTFQRFRPQRHRRVSFNESHLQQLQEHRIGQQRMASADGIEAGWVGGAHVLDTCFGLAKNIVNDSLVFDLRIDTNKPPAELLKAYTAIELAALSKDNPSGYPSKRQRREAKESAQERLEQEAKDGRFIKRKTVPVMWDGRTGEVLFGSTSIADADRFTVHFRNTFDDGLTSVTAGILADGVADFREYTPSAFMRDGGADDVAWSPGDMHDWLGNEFLVWLWHYLDVEGDTLTTADGDATAMIAKGLTLQCPRAATGTSTIKHEMPNRLPEANRAIQTGKLPRKAGLVLVHQGDTFEFTLQAETFALCGVKLPDVSEDTVEPRARQETRVDQLRELIRVVDGLYRTFLDVRHGNWPERLAGIREWLEGRQ